MGVKTKMDVEAVRREYKAGQLSVNAIALMHGVGAHSVERMARRRGWDRDLEGKVRDAVTVKLSGVDVPPHEDSVEADREIIDMAAERGVAVVRSHRKDLRKLAGIRDALADNLTKILAKHPDANLEFMGKHESLGDLMLKLSRTGAMLIEKERQAFSLDESGSSVPIVPVIDYRAE